MVRITDEHLALALSLFRGRTDVYARHWEKEGRSGYSPAYKLDWKEFSEFKKQGGTLKTFKNKECLPLTKDVVLKHLNEWHTVGIYPILKDNTSYFIVADFDGENWFEEAKAYLAECGHHGLKGYLERSRSGNGGHVWIFFEESYPCYKSRQTVMELIRKALKFSDFDKEISFDRLFPNQDTVSKDGFGNLIALPLQGQAVRRGNMVFLNPATWSPYPDQWEFLKSIKKHATSELDAVHATFFHRATIRTSTAPVHTEATKLSLTLDNKITLHRPQLNSELVHFLREHLNFMNTEYLVKQRIGKSLYNTPKYFKFVEEQGDEIYIPRGFLKHLSCFLNENNISYALTDHRPRLEARRFSSQIQLHPEQAALVEKILTHDSGVIVAPSGSGKTIIGLELIARRSLPALILVHRKQLLDQWKDRIQTFLGIPKTHIGEYSGIKKKSGTHVTVAMLQSFARLDKLQDMKNSFGTIIVDECHHIPAKTFREVISCLNARFLYGLTATPKRKHNDEPLIYIHIGEIIAEMKHAPIMALASPTTTDILVRETSLTLPFKYSTDDYQLLSKVICFDTARNQQIVKDILEQTESGKKVLVLSERRDHMDILNLYMKGKCETLVISGEDTAGKRALKLKQILHGDYQVVLSTGQFFGEGLDVPTIDCLILAFPFSFEGKLIQYMGRLRGHDNHKVILDYRDKQIPFLERQFKLRHRHYKKIHAHIG